MRVFTVMLLLCLFAACSDHAPARAESADEKINVKVRIWESQGLIWYPPSGLYRSADPPPSIDVKVRTTWEFWDDFGYPLPGLDRSFDFRKPDEFIRESVTGNNCVRMPDLREPLPLVAYVIQDKAEESGTASPPVFPACRGYLVLSEKNGDFCYAWTGKNAGDMPSDTYVDGASSPEYPHSWWLVFRWGDPQRCEIARQYGPEGFFLWMRSISIRQPHYRIFFTAGSPPDDAWVPEFGPAEAPDNRPRLKNPLPGMRPAPWQPPALKVE